jgi:hypothetical protein
MNAALSAIEGQRKARAALVDEAKAGGIWRPASRTRYGGRRGDSQVETEAAPMRYVAAVFRVNDQEAAIRWLIALICCDPLAIALTAAASSRR